MAAQRESTADLGATVVRGLVAGLAAGLVYAIVAFTIAILLGNPSLLVDPLRLPAAIVLGAATFTPAASVASVLTAGTFVYVLALAVYGAVFALVVALIFAATPVLAEGTATLLVAGSLFGLLLWVLNYLVIGATYSPAFTTTGQVIFGLVTHTFGYGAVLGLLLSLVWPRAT